LVLGGDVLELVFSKYIIGAAEFAGHMDLATFRI
jgi:hypothetical protein